MYVSLPSTINKDPAQSAQHALGVAGRLQAPVYMVQDWNPAGEEVFKVTLTQPCEVSYLKVEPSGRCEAHGAFALLKFGDERPL